MSESKRTIAIFDFDGTLVRGDSFFPFLSSLAGWPNLLLHFCATCLLYLVRKAKNSHGPDLIDYRTFFKAELLRRLAKGHKTSELPAVLADLCGWQKWNPSMKAALMEHHDQGHHIAVASGGLDLYLYELLKTVPINGLICTQIGIDDGTLTGVMISGNCVRQHKADLVAAYMEKHGPFDDSWGYGNIPHDLPMLALLKHRVIV